MEGLFLTFQVIFSALPIFSLNCRSRTEGLLITLNMSWYCWCQNFMHLKHINHEIFQSIVVHSSRLSANFLPFVLYPMISFCPSRPHNCYKSSTLVIDASLLQVIFEINNVGEIYPVANVGEIVAAAPLITSLISTITHAIYNNLYCSKYDLLFPIPYHNYRNLQDSHFTYFSDFLVSQLPKFHMPFFYDFPQHYFRFLNVWFLSWLVSFNSKSKVFAKMSSGR